MPVARACVLRDYRCDWAFEDGRICMDFRSMRHVHQWYRALRRTGLGTDVVHPHADLTGYDLIIVPSLVLVDDTTCAALEAAAARGAVIVLTAMTGLRNAEGISLGSYVHPRLTALAGITVEEQLPLFVQEDTALAWTDGTTHRGHLWHDLVQPAGAEVLATYASRFFAGTPVVTRQGRVSYVGTVLDEAATARVVAQAIADANLVPVATGDHDQVEVTEVAGPEGRFLYVLNFSDQERTIRLGEEATDLFNGTACGPVVTLPALDGRVFRLL
jgi:beta-galactosidase